MSIAEISQTPLFCIVIKIKKMKKKLIFIIASFLSGLVQNSLAEENVVVTDVNGEKISFLLSSSPIVSFNEQSLIITTDNETVFYPISEYRSFTIESDQSDLVEVTNSHQNPSFYFNENLVANGLEPSSKVSVYNVLGILISEGSTDENGSLILPINANKASIYVVSTSVGSFKVIVH